GSPWFTCSGDMNGDGIADIVSANSSGNILSVIFCDSTGNLSQPVYYPTGNFTISTDLGDVDGDGDLDVVTSNYSSGDFTLYENDGTGVLINRRDLKAKTAGSCSVFHDRDNDGDLDMTGVDEIDDLLILFENEGVVSVELVSFYTTVIGNDINLQWETATEINNLGFEVYRNGNKIGFINGSGSTVEKQEYSFIDKNLNSGIYNYRLNQIDFDGTQKVVGELTTYLSLPENFNLDQNYPNPFNPSTTISFTIPNSEFVNLKIFDVLGNEVTTLINKEMQTGNYKIDFDAGSLSGGIYFYKIVAGSFSETRKMVLLK
ncbi:MAG TPA: FG-GAP-like repeat-containing protein, partial [Ignavibacteriaceae bacterium]|nr:FG-GAP-like repeat-containing protein [Ignavibacteriaceae bacterium]